MPNLRSPLLALLVLATSCAGPPSSRSGPVPSESSAPAVAAVPEPPPAAAVPTYPLLSLGHPGEAGSGVALGRLGDRRLAFVADEDDRAVHTVDLDSREDLAVTPLGEAPSQLVIGHDGLLYVGLRSASAVRVLGSSGAPGEPLHPIADLPTAAEPIGLTLAPGGETLLVTSGITHELTSFALADRRRLFRVDLPREPRSIAVPGDGKRAFVSHAAGSVVSIVELGKDPPSAQRLEIGAGLQPYSGLCFPPSPRAPQRPAPPPARAAAMPGVQGFGLAEVNGTLYLPAAYVLSRSSAGAKASGYGPDEGFTEISHIAAVDLAMREVYPASLVIQGVQGEACLLPRAVARNPARQSLLVTCLGRDIVMEAMLRPDSANYDDPSGRVWQVPAGPTGLAVDEARREAVVFSQLDRAVSLLDLAPEKVAWWTAPKHRVVSIPLRPLAAALDPAWAQGRRLFVATDRRLSRDGRACASCHPDGRDDGLTWTTPRGLRQTPMLAGRLQDTAPYGWEGLRDQLTDHLTNTIAHRLQGRGLDEAELGALAAYVIGLPAPARGARPLGAEEARGEALFRSDEVGCAGCHRGAALADGLTHDVQSGGRFDTPSLRFLAGTAPYAHDGRYPTLRAMLLDLDGRMGRVGQLEERDLGALEAYLLTL